MNVLEKIQVRQLTRTIVKNVESINQSLIAAFESYSDGFVSTTEAMIQQYLDHLVEAKVLNESTVKGSESIDVYAFKLNKNGTATFLRKKRHGATAEWAEIDPETVRNTRVDHFRDGELRSRKLFVFGPHTPRRHARKLLKRMLGVRVFFDLEIQPPAPVEEIKINITCAQHWEKAE